MVSRLAANLQLYGALSADEHRAVEGLVVSTRAATAGEDLALEGDAPTQCRVLLEGQAFRHRTLPDGRRQIMSFHIPGDVCDLQGLFLAMDHNVTALTACEVGLIPHARLSDVMEAHPRIARAFWRTSLVEAAIFREWMVGMGRRTAYARIAHLFCEIVVRMRAVGMVHQNRCIFPITQQHLSDSLGLSAVHTNRTLQALRGEGLLSFQGGELAVLDWPGLKAAGEFDDGYLHLGENIRLSMAGG
ncbi:MAG: Crp/Fnr family transcriptional regulator [Phenylobacterium sp.]|jgi:CRP-like cAMP-binding protein|nr:Crp/Fnr family transcriptional regulator [Phenylobacterium sp.]